MLVPIILAGGSGTRLWPLSREAHPKQFIPLLEGLSLFQHTIARLGGLPSCQAPIVVGNEQHRFLIAEQLREISCHQSQIILEPDFKGTAPAITLAAVQALAQYDQDVHLLVLPADHVISDGKGFVNTVMNGISLANHSKLVTFGVVPSHPETGYGYIQKGKPIEGGFKIARFIEKPELATAERYFASKEYWWNSGMFLFSAASFIQELLLHSPEIYHAAKNAMAQAKISEDFIRPDKTAFIQCPSDSIDYAVMEKTHNGVVVPLESTWNDVGAWDVLAKLFVADENSNVCTGDVITTQTTNCLIQSNQRLVVTVGVKGLVIVETSDAVLVMDKNSAQDIKPIVNKMREKARNEVIFHRRVNRPWGAFESVDSGERFQVKRIMVAVGGKLSLQRHQHRSEHWVVVKGKAQVTRGEETFFLNENQSTYIPSGINHRLENAGDIPLEIIEVQSGSYLGEDDIIRLEDHYGRAQEEGNIPSLELSLSESQA